MIPLFKVFCNSPGSNLVQRHKPQHNVCDFCRISILPDCSLPTRSIVRINGLLMAQKKQTCECPSRREAVGVISTSSPQIRLSSVQLKVIAWTHTASSPYDYHLTSVSFVCHWASSPPTHWHFSTHWLPVCMFSGLSALTTAVIYGWLL